MIGDIMSNVSTTVDIVSVLLIVWFSNRETTVLNNDFMIIVIKNPNNKKNIYIKIIVIINHMDCLKLYI